MNSQLIPVFTGELNNQHSQLIDARSLHKFLGVGRDFSNWIKDRIEDYSFLENLDFIRVESLSSPKLASSKSRPQKVIDYHIAIDMAKELGMIERNDKGREIRRYFIEMERQAKQPAIQNPEPPTQKALKNGLSLDQQDCIKAFVQSRCEALPKDKQRGGFLRCWSALKSKFGTSYKQIQPGDFNNALSLLARLDLGGEPVVTISPSELDTIIQNKLDAAKRTPEATPTPNENTSPQACIARLKANAAFAIPNQILPNIKRDLNLLEQHLKTLKTDHQVIQDLMDAGFFIAPKTLMITNFETWTNTNKFNPAWMIRSM
jgi:phage anti-repressor protein